MHIAMVGGVAGITAVQEVAFSEKPAALTQALFRAFSNAFISKDRGGCWSNTVYIPVTRFRPVSLDL